MNEFGEAQYPTARPGGRRREAVPPGGHELPPLPYPYDALEPYISATTLRIHHDRHHLAYVNGLNRAELALVEARESGNFSLVKHWERELAFHGSGHILHSIYWTNMTPGGGGSPGGLLAVEINRAFGSFAAFRGQFGAAAGQVEASGWAILVWQPY
ncbi:MAG: superoxide dismutase, partial [Chloroflexi bacterium]|nr:superoxide dismutase [Chloroflexota bacterium]